MTELTLTLDDRFAESLEQLARDRAMPLAQFIENEMRDAVKREDARKRLRLLVERAPIPLAADRHWNREDLYDRPMLRGYKRPPVRGGGTS